MKVDVGKHIHFLQYVPRKQYLLQNTPSRFLCKSKNIRQRIQQKLSYPILQELETKKRIHIARTLLVHGEIQAMETFLSNN